MKKYVNIRTEWLTEWGLTPSEAVVFGYLHGWVVDAVDKSVPFRQTQQDMAEAVGMKLRTFKAIMQKLVRLGLVTVSRTSRGSWDYACARMFNIEESAKSAPGAKSAPSECKICTEVGAKSAPTTLLNINNNTYINMSENARAREEGESDERKEEGDKVGVQPVVPTAQPMGDHRDVDSLADELRQETCNGSQFAESIHRLYGLTTDGLLEYIGWFADKLHVDGVRSKSRSDFRRHFQSWLKIQLSEKIKQQQRYGNTRNNRHQPQYSAEFMAGCAADIASGN